MATKNASEIAANAPMIKVGGVVYERIPGKIRVRGKVFVLDVQKTASYMKKQAAKKAAKNSAKKTSPKAEKKPAKK